MNKIFTTLSFLFLLVNALAQAPETISYQAIVRNADGNVRSNAKVGMQINILQYSADGNSVYEEIQQPETNNVGLISIEIGAGESSENFSGINWADGPFFIQTNIDPEGGLNYSITTLSQLLSVPYALHAKTAETTTGNIGETDPLFASSPAAGISAEDISEWNNKGGETDPVFSAAAAADITNDHIQKLNNLSGTNTGDQNISGIAENERRIREFAGQIRSEISEVNSNFAKKNNVLELNNSSAFTPDSDYQPATKKYVDDKEENDPLFTSSPTYQISSSDFTRWNNELTSEFEESDPVFFNSSAKEITDVHLNKLNDLEGVNTGNQDISGILENKEAIQNMSQRIRNNIPVLDGFLSKTEVLELDNTTTFTPNSDYEPATKGYTDSTFADSTPTISLDINIPYVSHLATKNNVLTLNNTDQYYPEEDYHPVTKAYVDNIMDSLILLYDKLLVTEQQLNGLVTSDNVLILNNEDEYTPELPYHPATKEYVDLLEDDIAAMEIALQRPEKSIEQLLDEKRDDQVIKAEKFRGRNADFAEFLRLGLSIEELEEEEVTLQNILNSPGITIEELLNTGAEPEDLYGLNYQGGILFYIQNSVAYAGSPERVSLPWDPNVDFHAIGAEETLAGTGELNTERIVAALGDGMYAAKYCYDLERNGYNDWYLPAYEETFPLSGVLEGVQNILSSTEKNATHAYNYDNGMVDELSKGTNGNVYAVRSFDIANRPIDFLLQLLENTPVQELTDLNRIIREVTDAGQSRVLTDIGLLQHLLNEGNTEQEVINLGVPAEEIIRIKISEIPALETAYGIRVLDLLNLDDLNYHISPYGTADSSHFFPLEMQYAEQLLPFADILNLDPKSNKSLNNFMRILQELLNTENNLELDSAATIRELLDQGKSIRELFIAGKGIQELLDAAVSIGQLLDAGIRKEFIERFNINYGGGTLAYIDESNRMAYVSSKRYNSYILFKSFSSDDDQYLIRTEEAIGTGKTNTDKIVTALGEDYNYAAEYCYNLEENGYDDWHLPSLGEAASIFNLRLFNLDFELITSTEVNENEVYAVEYTSSGISDYSENRISKTSRTRTLPVRSFPLDQIAIGDLLNREIPIPQDIVEGISLQDFLDRGIHSRLLLVQGYTTIQELRNAGITTRQLLNGLEDLGDLYDEGLSGEQILTIARQVLGSEALLQEFFSEEFPIQGLLYDAWYLTETGITIQELNDVVPFQQLITVGGATVKNFLIADFTIQQLREVGITIRQMLAENIAFLRLINSNITLEDFRNEGYTNQELLDEGITLSQLIDLGATIEELGNEGYPIQELLDGDIAIQDLLTTYNIQKEYLYGLDYQGGILFYIDEINNLAYVGSEEHSFKRWSPRNHDVIGTEQGIGYGKSNTEKIVTALGEGDYAAKYCDDLDLNNYTDWFLPSIDELREFAKYIAGEQDIQIFSSSESDNSERVSLVNFNEYLLSTSSKTYSNAVYPVRSFALTEKGNPETN